MTIARRSPRPSCPACGFAVFNRRYSKCERCQAVLPSEIAYTEGELGELRKRDMAEELQAIRQKARMQPDGVDFRSPWVAGEAASSLDVDLPDLGSFGPD